MYSSVRAATGCTRGISLGKSIRARPIAVQAKNSAVVKDSGSAKFVDVMPADAAGVQGWRQLVALSGLVAVICSVDRASISVAILPMSAEYLWDDSTKGLISSAFFIG